jgi:hypothetical protein
MTPFSTPSTVGLSFYEFNPLGGGFFTGRYKGLDTVPDEGSRFDLSRGSYQAKGYRCVAVFFLFSTRNLLYVSLWSCRVDGYFCLMRVYLWTG